MDRLERSFEAACDPFVREIGAVNAKAARFQQQVERGEAAWIVEHDGWQRDRGEEMSEEIDAAEDSLLTLRKAFTILLYHEWEKQAQLWFKHNGRPSGTEIEAGVVAAGLPVSPTIDEIRLLVNTMKHNSIKFGPKLYERRGDFFKPNFDPDELNPFTNQPRTNVDYDDAIILNDAHLAEFFKAVRASGPDTHSTFAPAT